MRRLRIAGLLLAAAWCGAAGARAEEVRSGLVTHGPYLHAVDHEWVHVWARFSEAGRYLLVATKEGDTQPSRVLLKDAEAENDFCVRWEIAMPSPDATYSYVIMRGAEVIVSGPECVFRTPPAAEAPQTLKLAFGSCANPRAVKEQPVWGAILASGAQGLVLLGDTPYIDTTDLETQRARYREFFGMPELGGLLRRMPMYATWDDHDFGGNNADGTLAGKENARRAFFEYHAMPRVGGGTSEGIYTNIRRGPVELFLLDTRWFMNTEPSMWEAAKPALLGGAQWQWLTKALQASTAPFKVVCSGMVWNDLVPEEKMDCWARYGHERVNFFRFVGLHKIGGVILVSGDLHWSRVVRMNTRELAGYDITEIVTSPLASTTLKGYDVPGPGLLYSGADRYSFLLLTADTTQSPARLQAELRTASGEVMYAQEFSEGALR
jgi:alkaline phosphatase D